MKKLWFVVIGAIVAAGGFYYFSPHAYFIKTELYEKLPMPVVPVFDSSDTSGFLAPQMRTVAVGSFGEVDFIHKGSGQVKLIEIDGKTILRLENFNVTNGPDLYVYLSHSANPTHNIKDLGDYVNLGRLKATSGEQNYDVPVGAEGYKTVVIWCRQFGVLFSFAVMN